MAAGGVYLEAVSIGKGMRLHVIPSDKFMTSMICALIRRPLNRDEATLNALLPSVLCRGSAAYPTQTDIMLAAEKMRGSIFDSAIIKKGEQQIIQFYFECVNDQPALRSDGLSFLQEIILQPLSDGGGFKSAYVRGEADHLRTRIEGRVNNKSDYAKLKCVEFMCEGEPFGIYGDGYAEDLPDITPERLFHHYKKVVETSPVDFIAIGAWDEPKLQAQLSTLFSIYRDEVINIEPPTAKPARAEKREEQLAFGATQGNLCVGLRSDLSPIGDGYIHFQLANEILGGGANAKLFVNVREKESLCYSIQSFIYRFKGLLCIQCGADASQFEHILSLVDDQISAMKSGDITDDELDNAKRSLSKRWMSLQDNPSGCVDFYASQYLLNDPDTIDQMVARMAAATKDGVVEAAGHINTDTVVTVK